MLHSSDASVDHSVWKRFQEEETAVPFPLLVLDSSATIQRSTPSACRLLSHASDDLNGRSFLSLVHGRNVQRVMRDLAQLVHRHVQTASWLLRLRTGSGRWRWYRALARVSPHAAASRDTPTPSLFVRLRPV